MADVHEGRPGRGDGPGGPGPGHGRRGVEPAQPVGGDEELHAGQLVRPVEDHRDALRRIAVLVHVGRHGRYPGQTEVERLVHAAELGQEGKEEAAHARVDVAQDAAVQRQRGDVGDGVDDAVGIGGGGADHHDRVVVARVGQRPGADPEVGIHRDTHQLDVEVVGRLGERRVSALGGHDARPRHAAGAPDVARRLHRLQQALGAARGQVALDGASRRRVVGTEQRRRVGDDVVLHDADAREGQHVEPVLGAVERQRVGEQLVDVVARRVDQAEDAAAPPVLVVLLHGDQSLHHFVAGEALLGHRRVGERGHAAVHSAAEPQDVRRRGAG